MEIEVIPYDKFEGHVDTFKLFDRATHFSVNYFVRIILGLWFRMPYLMESI